MTSVTASPALSGRLTARGSDELEARLNAVLGEVAQRVRIAVRQDERVALVLHGGYGRGEGGVERSGGEERLHNNLDLLVVSPGRPTQELRARVDQALAPIARRAGIGIDAGVVAARSITSAPHLVMWHDMHHAHRTLLGDPRFVRSLERFSGPDIEPWDVRNLLSNRATLLLLARSVLDGRPVDDAVARSVIKHVMKAIIGYGDAFLFFNGRYHHLYAVKQARMRAFTGADPELRALYDEAIEFRFEPTYEATRQRHPDLQAWLGHVTRSLAPVHLACERARLARPQLEWDEYLELALGHALLEGPWTARGCARRLSRLTEGGLEPGAARSVWARAGARIADARSRLAIVLPAVLYDLPKASRETAARLLGSISVDRETLCRAYLRAWGRDGDPNFGAVARQLKLRTGQHRTEAA